MAELLTLRANPVTMDWSGFTDELSVGALAKADPPMPPPKLVRPPNPENPEGVSGR
jgi:hypothetical protein